MPHADVNGQHLYYEATGVDGPVLVFSHGLFMDRSMFDPQVLKLRDRYRCIAWDERGHGDTNAPDGPFSFWDSADDLKALLDHLGVDHAVLVGMSQGGYLSLRAALRYPTLVRALVLIDTQAGTEDPERLPYYEQLLGQWNTAGLTDDLTQIIATLILGEGWSGTPEWVERWHQLQMSSVNECFITLASREDLHDRLPEITVPALVIHGEQDLSIPLERAQRLADGLPHSVLRTIPGAGHAANLTHPEPVTEAIELFLDALPG
jgi:pimeloyl-ACP methyl ester carboxylesterase